MRIDLYARAVLTAIALCLMWLCIILTPIGTPLVAQPLDSVQDVRIVGIRHPGYEEPDRFGRRDAPRKLLDSWDSVPTYDGRVGSQ